MTWKRRINWIIHGSLCQTYICKKPKISSIVIDDFIIYSNNYDSYVRTFILSNLIILVTINKICLFHKYCLSKQILEWASKSWWILGFKHNFNLYFFNTHSWKMFLNRLLCKFFSLLVVSKNQIFRVWNTDIAIEKQCLSYRPKKSGFGHPLSLMSFPVYLCFLQETKNIF